MKVRLQILRRLEVAEDGRATWTNDVTGPERMVIRK